MINRSLLIAHCLTPTKFPPMTKRTWVNMVSSIFQFILGFVLGIALIAGVGAGIAYYYFKTMSSHVPTKPVYEEEKKSLPSTKQDSIAKKDSSITSESTIQPEAIPKPTPELEITPKLEPTPELEPTSELETTPELEPTSEPEPIPEPEPELPPNAYFARVTWPQGLSLRAEPSLDAERIGGIDFNARIIILEDSSDKKWQRIRIPESQREAWVKAGNVKKD